MAVSLRYTTLEAVKNRMKSGPKTRVRFPGPPRIEAFDQDEDYLTTVSVDQTLVTSKPAFEGSIRVKVEFTSPTEFQVYKTTVAGRDFRPMLDGSGNIASDYDRDDFTIGAGTFGGAPKAGDQIWFDFEVDISEDRAIELIAEVERRLKDLIWEDLIDPEDIEADESLGIVAAYMSACHIYTDVHLHDDVEASSGHFISRWQKRAMDGLESVLKRFNREIGGVDVASLPWMVNSVGGRHMVGGVGYEETGYDRAPVCSEEVFDADLDGGWW